MRARSAVVSEEVLSLFCKHTSNSHNQLNENKNIVGLYELILRKWFALHAQIFPRMVECNRTSLNLLSSKSCYCTEPLAAIDVIYFPLWFFANPSSFWNTCNTSFALNLKRSVLAVRWVHTKRGFTHHKQQLAVIKHRKELQWNKQRWIDKVLTS